MVREYFFDHESVHPSILDICREFYTCRDHDRVCKDAADALVNLVKEKSGKHQLDGMDLIDTVFHKDDPIIAFDYLEDRHDPEVQEGMLFIIKGTVKVGQNDKSRKLIAGDPEKALHYVSVVNSIANHLEKARLLKNRD